MEHKNNIIKTLFVVYIAFMIFLLASGVGEHGISVGAGKAKNFNNGYYYFMLLVGGLATAIFYGIYYYLMDKWNILLKCPFCGKTQDISKISISPADGFLGRQTCQKCGEKYVPSVKDDKGKR